MEDVRIYIADQRGEQYADRCRLRSTFNYGDFFHQDKHGIGRLLYWNEWEGLDSKEFVLSAQGTCTWMLIPTATGIEVTFQSRSIEVEVGKVCVLVLDKDDEVKISSVEKEEAGFSFLQIVQEGGESIVEQVQLFTLPLQQEKNSMLSVLDKKDFPFQLHIGAFHSKEESVWECNDKSQSFIYVLDGSFEVEGRLLFQGDGLSMYNKANLDIECLGAVGLIVVLEMS